MQALKRRLSSQVVVAVVLVSVVLLLYPDLIRTVRGHNVERFDILAARFDNMRYGYNLNEIIMSPTTLDKDNYGKIFERNVTGHVHSQLLYLFELEMQDGLKRNALYVSTSENHIVAFDPDTPSNDGPLWQRKLDEPVNIQKLLARCGAESQVTDYMDAMGMQWLNGEATVGITSTPCIDPQSKYIYVVTMCTDSNGHIAHYIHSLDSRNGETVREPVPITATSGSVEFRSEDHIQRTNLILHRNTLFVAFGGYCPSAEHHGWVLGYDTSNGMQQTHVWCSTPLSSGGSIWRHNAVTIDSRGQMLVATGVGGYDGTDDFGDSIVLIDTASMAVKSHRTLQSAVGGQNSQILYTAGAATISPESKFIFAVDGSGRLSLLSMTDLSVIYELKMGERIDEIVTVRTNYDSFYVWPAGSVLYHLHLDEQNDRFEVAARGTVTLPKSESFGGICLTGDDEIPVSGIVWATHTQTVGGERIGIMRAFEADDVSRELWNSEMHHERDRIGTMASAVSPLQVGATAYIPILMPDKSTRIAAYSDLKPRVVKYPVTYVVTDPGMETNFSVVATGLPPLRYQWYYAARDEEERAIVSATEPNYSAVFPASGVCFCRVSNDAGEIDSYRTTVIVRKMGDNDDGYGTLPQPSHGGGDDDGTTSNSIRFGVPTFLIGSLILLSFL